MYIAEIPKISLAAARTNAGMSQTEMAVSVGVSRETIWNWEKGNSEPSVNQLRKISELSHIPIDFIFVPDKS